MLVDYLIIGSGITGATIARILTDAGREVLVLDRREHVGGNVHDHAHPCGIPIHTYGPHYFRTGSETVWEFVTRFSAFCPYKARLMSMVGGVMENWPIAGSYIKRAIGKCWDPGFRGTPTNFEEASLSMMPSQVYRDFVKGYTEKQWGVPANTLDASLARRFDVRLDDEPCLTRHKYQGIPENGYASFTVNMLRGIPVLLNFDYLKNRTAFHPRRKLIFTGPIDGFFNFRFGRLKYRGQRRVHQYVPDRDFVQPCCQVNNPSPHSGPHIRTLEWKHLMPLNLAVGINGTVLTTETPYTPDDPDAFEYPFPDELNASLFQKYRDLADTIADTLVCGRLGEYRYLDMDQAIARAMQWAARLLD